MKICHIVGAVLLVTGFFCSPANACPDSDFAEVRELIAPDGTLVVRTSSVTADVEVNKGGRVVWAGRVKHVDCALTAEMIRIQVERRLEPKATLAVGTVPSLSVLKPRTATQAVSRRSQWTMELGAAGQWDLVGRRVGGSLEWVARYAGWGGRVELGGFGPRTEALDDFGDARFFSLHGLVLGEGCRGLFNRFRVCGAAGGGVEWVEARSQGAGIFQQTTERRWAPRVDLTASFAWNPKPFGAELVVHGQWRPSPTRVQIMGVAEDTGLSRFALVLGIRGFLSFL